MRLLNTAGPGLYQFVCCKQDALYVISSQLEEQLADLQEKVARDEQNFQSTTDKLKETIQGLKERLKTIDSEKERALRDKDNLLDEVFTFTNPILSLISATLPPLTVFPFYIR